MAFYFAPGVWAQLGDMAFLLRVAGLAAFAIGIPCWRFFSQQRTLREDQQVRKHPRAAVRCYRRRSYDLTPAECTRLAASGPAMTMHACT